MPKLISIYWDQATASCLNEVLGPGDSLYFHLAPGPESADVIIFGDDRPRFLRAQPLYRQFPEKCIVVTEGDLPSYFVPSIYTSNRRCLLGRNRSLTSSYYCALVHLPNLSLQQFQRQPAPKKWLYSFLGGSTSWLRKRMFRHMPSKDDALIESTDTYEHWNFDPKLRDLRAAHQLRYAEVLAASKFFLCPRGAGTSSIRLFEVMQMGVAPVIISDQWIAPQQVDWEFALFVRESQFREIDAIVRSHADEWRQRGEAARRAFDRYFSPEAAPRILTELVVELKSRYSPRREALVHTIYPLVEAYVAAFSWVRRVGKMTVLWTFDLLKLNFPYKLNRPIKSQLGK